MIGAARPSIADPFLPKKIEEGRADDIRECIGCNICVTGDYMIAPIRCTQNPTMGEEWRRGWHPEFIAPRKSADRVLIVGAGPAGLEAAHALGKRGYEVHLAEASTEVGGRVSRESKLPGLSAWARVRDYRLYQIGKLPNVHLYRDSRLDADQVREFGFEHVVLATGAYWRKDGIGRSHYQPIPGFGGDDVLTPDDIMADRMPVAGPVVVFDDELFYMAGVLAEKVRKSGLDVTLVTPADSASSWTANTLELHFINKRLRDLGVKIVTAHDVTAFDGRQVEIACGFTGKSSAIVARSVVTVTARLPHESLYLALMEDQAALKTAGIRSVTRIGDCLAPGFIAHAVYAGHKYARDLDEPAQEGEVTFRRTLPLTTTQ